MRGQQVRLLEEIVELVRRPFGISEALVPRIGLHDGQGGLARHAMHRGGPQFQIGLAQTRLQLDRALRIGKPIFGNVPERLNHVGDLVGWLDLDLAFLARLEISSERLAAFLDHARDVLRETLNIDRTRCRRGDGNFSPSGGLIVHALPARAVASFEDFGPWFRHISGINLFEAILTDTLLVVHCGVSLRRQ